jgi:hypothetical protein
MEIDQLTSDEELVKIERWFSETYKNHQRSSEEIQLLILYKLHQLEERVNVVEQQTKTHWVN